MENTKTPRRFAPSIRQLDVTVDRLEVRWSWGAGGFGDTDERDGSEQLPTVRLIGRAKLNRGDSISAIGLTTPAVRELQFELRGYETWEEHVERAARSRHLSGLLPTEVDGVRVLSDAAPEAIEAEFESRPASAHVGFMEKDWELGISDTWFLECFAPMPVVRQLTSDLRNGFAQLLDVYVELAPTLTDDEHAPPSVSVTFGVLKGSSSGWLNSLHWRPAPPASEPRQSKDESELATYESSGSIVRLPLSSPKEMLETSAIAEQLGRLASVLRLGLLAISCSLVLLVVARCR